MVEHQGQLALNELQRGQLGLQLPARFGSVEVDTASFLLRQQETAAAAVAESNISPEQQGEGVGLEQLQHMQGGCQGAPNSAI